MNQQIIIDNLQRKRNKAHIIKPVSQREFCVFLAIFLIARLEAKKGSALWAGDEKKGEGYKSQIDISHVMKRYRHEEIRKYFAIFFADHLKKDSDSWWQVIGGVDGYNKNRKEFISSGKEKTPDESMSAFRPQTTKTGKFLTFDLHTH